MSRLSGEAGVYVEQAPSETKPESISLTRIIGGFGGLFLLTLGLASVIAAGYGRGLFGAEWGYLFTAVGVALLLFHSIRDRDAEVRRAYGVLGAVLLLVAVGVGVFPAKPDGASSAVAGQLLLPWGTLLGLGSLMFLVPFARNETAEPYKSWAHIALLGTGGLLSVGCILIGLANPDALAGPGLILGLLGLGFLLGYFSVTDTSVGLPYWVAAGLGGLGAAVIVYAVARTIAPTVLYEGAAALRTPDQKLDWWWAVPSRVAVILAGFASILVLRSKSLPPPIRYGIVAVGVTVAGVMFFGSFFRAGTTSPAPFLVPAGLILFALGVAYLLVSVGLTVDHPLVVLTRRELAGYFYSPIVYIVLFGAAVAAGLGHWFFRGLVTSAPSIPEPVLALHDGLKILSQIAVLFIVPALTMRSFSEETRTGTLEVLLTAPVSEWTVVFSKFFSTLFVLMLTWVPATLYLVSMRLVGGSAFDYRPLLSYYLAVLASGCAFVGMGLFFSSLTRNQVVAAVLTFAGMFALLMSYFLSGQIGTAFKDLPREAARGITEVLVRVGYVDLWNKSLIGQLEVNSVILNLSMAALWLFLCAKTLESRKWR